MNTQERKARAVQAPRQQDEFGDLRQEVEQYRNPITVTDADSYRAAVDLRAGARTYIAKVTAKFAPLIADAQAALNKARSLALEAKTPALQMIERIDVEIAAFEVLQENERKRQEIRLAKDQEEQERTRRILEVEHLRRTGYVGEAKKLNAEPLPPAIVPTLPVNIPRVNGFQKRTLWEAEVDDLAALRKAYRAAGSTIPDEAMVHNPTFLNAMARASKSTLNIPGVKATNKTVRAQRRS